MHIAVDFDFAKYCSPSSYESLNIQTFETSRVSPNDFKPNKDTVLCFNWPHSCTDTKPKSSLIKVDLFKSGIMDYNYFMKLFEKNPYAPPSQIKSIADIEGKFFKDRTLEQMIQYCQ